MLRWLDAHAGAVQAVTAVASLGLAAVLAWLTWSYGRANRDLVKLTREQLEMLKAERTAQTLERRRRLVSLISHLRSIANALPSSEAPASRIRGVALWSTEDLRELHRIAVSFGSEAGDLAAEAARHLATIAELAKSIDEHRGERLTGALLDWNQWNRARQGAERCLNSIDNAIDRAS